MKCHTIAALLVLLLSASTVSFSLPNQQPLPEPAEGTEAEHKEAIKAAREFLGMIDRNDYKPIWRNAVPSCAA